jgi:hypothetical protein
MKYEFDHRKEVGNIFLRVIEEKIASNTLHKLNKFFRITLIKNFYDRNSLVKMTQVYRLITTFLDSL